MYALTPSALSRVELVGWYAGCFWEAGWAFCPPAGDAAYYGARLQNN